MNEQTDVPAPVALLQMLTGYWVSKALSVAADLGVADHLEDGPRAVTELAAECGAEPAALYRLLRALASVGVFAEEDGDRFGLTPLAELLRSDVPGSMRALARMYGSEQFQAWAGLEESIRTGKPSFDQVFGTTVWDYFANNPETSAVFNDAMTGWTRNWPMRWSRPTTSATPDRSSTWAGGSGCCSARSSSPTRRRKECSSRCRKWQPTPRRSWRRPASWNAPRRWVGTSSSPCRTAAPSTCSPRYCTTGTTSTVARSSATAAGPCTPAASFS